MVSKLDSIEYCRYTPTREAWNRPMKDLMVMLNRSENEVRLMWTFLVMNHYVTEEMFDEYDTSYGDRSEFRTLQHRLLSFAMAYDNMVCDYSEPRVNDGEETYNIICGRDRAKMWINTEFIIYENIGILGNRLEHNSYTDKTYWTQCGMLTHISACLYFWRGIRDDLRVRCEDDENKAVPADLAKGVRFDAYNHLYNMFTSLYGDYLSALRDYYRVREDKDPYFKETNFEYIFDMFEGGRGHRRCRDFYGSCPRNPIGYIPRRSIKHTTRMPKLRYSACTICTKLLSKYDREITWDLNSKCTYREYNILGAPICADCARKIRDACIEKGIIDPEKVE